MKKLLLVAVVSLAASSVFAQNVPAADTVVKAREARQEARIEKGVQKGSITAPEAARLEKGQAHVEKMETKAIADGKVTPKEAVKLEHAQNKQSKHIRHAKHNGRHVKEQ